MSYEGPERRKDNLDLEARVRDLEEKDRAGTKSRELMHTQLEHLNTKMDLMLSRMDEKNDECALHKTKTALLEAAQAAADLLAKKDKQALDTRLQALEDDVRWAYRTGLSGTVSAVAALLGAFWAVFH